MICPGCGQAYAGLGCPRCLPQAPPASFNRRRMISFKTAFNCENARGGKCKCRCGGKLHGAARITADEDARKYLENLPPGDPHRIKKANRKLTQQELFEIFQTHEPQA